MKDRSVLFTAAEDALTLQTAFRYVTLSLAALLLLLLWPATAEAATVIVTSSAGVIDGNTSSITALNANPGADGVISLREALTAANNSAGANIVAFNIPDSDPGYNPFNGTWRIEPAATLLINGDDTTVDGFTQALSQGDRNPAGPEIEIHGGQTPPNTSGILISGDGNLLRGLAINGYLFDEGPTDTPSGAAVLISGQGNTVESCYLGSDPTGQAATGNYVGLSVPFALPSVTQLTTVRFNLISGNTYAGIYAAGKTRIQGNRIGVDASGALALPNRIGVYSFNTSSELQIGGTLPFEGNTIAYNLLDGIRWFGAGPPPEAAPVAASPALLSDSFALRNAIYGNGGSGITANPDQVTPTPVIASGDSVAGVACAGCRVEIFSTDGQQQGRVYEGFALADAGGAWVFAGLPDGPYLTATATGPDTPTSRFAAPVVYWPHLLVDTTADDSDGDTSGVQALQADPGPDGRIALREAIEAVNAQAGGEPILIGFSIPLTDAGYSPASGAWVIEPSPDLPCIDAGHIWLDGESQGRNQGDANPLGPEIVLSRSLPTGFGLQLCSDLNVVRGLVISGWQTGLAVTGYGNRILGNYIGVDPAGETAQGNFRGIVPDCLAGAVNQIGGRSPGEGNLISGNHGYAIYSNCSASLAPGVGVVEPDGVPFTVVQGNRIGTDRTGAIPLGNGLGAIWFQETTNGSQIGGAEPGAGNLIAFNGVLPAVNAQDCGVHQIRRNSIHHNVGLGIGRLTTCPNISKAPVIDSVCLATGTVRGHSPCLGCTAELFADEENEGQVYLGATRADASGVFTFTGELQGPNLTATVSTVPDGNTSQFSLAVALLGSPDVNCDGRVDIRDIQTVAGAWLLTPADADWSPAYDLDGNDVVDVGDIQAVAEAWS